MNVGPPPSAAVVGCQLSVIHSGGLAAARLFFGTSPSHIGSAQGKLLIAMSTSNGERVNFHDHIVRDPQICNGEPTIRGTRVTLRTILASLAEGNSEDEILHSFPALRREDVWTVIAFAAASAEEDLPVPELPAI